MIEDILCRIGLSENEAKVYLALLEMHKSSASVLSRRMKLDRNKARYHCQQLVKRGLITEKQEGNTLIFRALPPERIISQIEEKKSALDKKQSLVTQVMGLLNAIQNPMIQCPGVEYYEGKDGIIEIYEDMVATGTDIFCWTDIQKIDETLGKYMQEFIRKRVEAGITTYTFMPENKMNIIYAGKSEEKRTTRLVKSLPIEGEIRIYGEKVAVITFDKTKPVGFVFKSPLISNMFRSVFKNAWGGGH